MSAPKITDSTKEERYKYINETYKCIADCDMCGICKVFRGKLPEIFFEDYINGNREYIDVSSELK